MLLEWFILLVEEMRLSSWYGEYITAGTTRAVSTGFQCQQFCTWNAGHPENQPVKIQCQEFTGKLPIPQKDHVGVEKIFTLQTPPKIANLESRDVFWYFRFKEKVGVSWKVGIESGWFFSLVGLDLPTLPGTGSPNISPRHVPWVDDFPNFPRSDMVSSLGWYVVFVFAQHFWPTFLARRNANTLKRRYLRHLPRVVAFWPGKRMFLLGDVRRRWKGKDEEHPKKLRAFAKKGKSNETKDNEWKSMEMKWDECRNEWKLCHRCRISFYIHQGSAVARKTWLSTGPKHRPRLQSCKITTVVNTNCTAKKRVSDGFRELFLRHLDPKPTSWTCVLSTLDVFTWDTGTYFQAIAYKNNKQAKKHFNTFHSKHPRSVKIMLWVTGVILCPSPSNPSLSFGSSLIRSEHWAPFPIDVYTNLMWFNLMCFCGHPKTTPTWRWNSYTRNTSIQKKLLQRHTTGYCCFFSNRMTQPVDLLTAARLEDFRTKKNITKFVS